MNDIFWTFFIHTYEMFFLFIRQWLQDALRRGGKGEWGRQEDFLLMDFYFFSLILKVLFLLFFVWFFWFSFFEFVFILNIVKKHYYKYILCIYFFVLILIFLPTTTTTFKSFKLFAFAPFSFYKNFIACVVMLLFTKFSL